MNLLNIPAAAIVAAMALTHPASAQQLSDGDYALCSVYDENDDFVGYDSVCLERKRAQLRRYQQQQAGSGAYADNGVYYCPSWANGGYGYSATLYSDGTSSSYGPFDRPTDGVPCIAHPNYIGSGYY